MELEDTEYTWSKHYAFGHDNCSKCHKFREMFTGIRKTRVVRQSDGTNRDIPNNFLTVWCKSCDGFKTKSNDPTQQKSRKHYKRLKELERLSRGS
jgi:hypothetical protein